MSTDTCLFCGLSFDDELTYRSILLGEKLQRGPYTLHQYCMVFCISVESKVKHSAETIIKTYKLVENKKCMHCGKLGANIPCMATQCENFYHLLCGIDKKCKFEYYGTYESYCPSHRTDLPPPPPAKLTDSVYINKHFKCICRRSVHPDLSEQFYLPCCEQWIHKMCLQIWIYKLGIMSLCPFCNDLDELQSTAMECNLNVPNTWPSLAEYKNILDDLEQGNIISNFLPE